MAFSVQQLFVTVLSPEMIPGGLRRLAGSFCLLAVLAGAVQAAPEVNSQIEQHFLAAQKAQQQGDLATSVREYRAILRLKPDFAEVRMNLGLVYHAQKKFEDSARELEEGLLLKPDLLGANLFLGINYCKLNQSARAIPYLQKVVACDPGNKEGLFWLASALLDSGDKLQAIQLLEKGVETRSGDLDLLHLLGVACQKAGRDAFDKVKALGAGSTHTSQILAESYASQGEWGKAVFHYRQLLQKSPAWTGAHLGLGVILLQQGKLTEAREHFLQELANDPFSAAAYARLGEVAVLQGDRPEALKSFRQALQIREEQALSALGLGNQPFWQQPQEGTEEGFRAPLEAALQEWSRLPDAEGAAPAAHLGLALVNARLGREAEARKALNVLQAPLKDLKTPVRESRGGSQQPGENQAMALFREKRYEEAVVLLERAVQAKPHGADARYALARSYFELHDYRKASAELGRILQRDSKHLAATALLGKCYQNLSLLAFGRIVALEPDSYRAHQLLGQAYEARNQNDKAIAE
ncbi:MAG: tetratricopeptide repeat protein, partial [Acidobacteria bacterium]|nr:tetratricopeptide repeat protein [Acidobacteriota bacterium]